IAPPVSAQNPCIGVSLVIFDPMVLTMRQPPTSVPSPIAAWQVIPTQDGTWHSPPICPWENNNTAMMPMVFCASLPPWPSEYSDAETNCSTRNRGPTPKGDAWRLAPGTQPTNTC